MSCTKRTIFAKPSECPTCYDSLDGEGNPLPCGHWIHMSCIRKGHKAECHLCRAPINIQVEGTLPPNNISFANSISDTYEDFIVNTYELRSCYSRCPECLRSSIVEGNDGFYVCSICGLCLDRIII